MTNTAEKNMQPTAVIARIFKLTPRRIQQLTQEGVLPGEKTAKGWHYDLYTAITCYIAYLKEQIETKRPQTMEEKLLEKLDAEIKYKNAKADKAQLELDELNGILHRASDIEKLTNELVFAVRSMLLALPGRWAMDLAAIDNAPEASQYMARQVAVLLDELATHEYNPDVYKQLVREREGWQAINDDEETDEAEV
ncbi:MAG: hypothetical protein IKW41_06790 [Phascolarctobacterium sp.]|nr:hypothetical protein [Phascolarctobacterium sp.]